MECSIKNLSLNYEVFGEGKPVIIIHGYSVDHRLMTGCLEPIFRNKKGYKRIYVDLPGMGKSESADWITNSDVMLDIMVEFINKVIPNESFLLAGQSYGGYISRGIIYKMASRVEGVLLICPAIIADYKKRKVPEHVVLVKDEKLLSTLTAEEAEDFNSMAVSQSEEIYDRYKKEIISGIKLGNEEFLRNLKQTGYEFSFEVDKLDEKFQKPSLIITGRQDDCVGYRDAWDILENFPRASFAVLDVAGHNLHLEQEEIFNTLVNEWLIRVDKM